MQIHLDRQTNYPLPKAAEFSILFSQPQKQHETFKATLRISWLKLNPKMLPSLSTHPSPPHRVHPNKLSSFKFFSDPSREWRKNEGSTKKKNVSENFLNNVVKFV